MGRLLQALNEIAKDQWELKKSEIAVIRAVARQSIDEYKASCDVK